MNSILFAIACVGLSLRGLGGDADVYLAAGQSNAAMDWAVAIEDKLASLNPARPQRVAHSQHSGHALWRWWTDSPGANFADDVAAIRAVQDELVLAGTPGTLKGIFWFQGESDAGNDASTAAYAGRFQAMVEALESEFGVAELPVLIHLIDLNPSPAYDDPAAAGVPSRERIENFRAMQVALAGSLNGLVLDTRGMSRTDAWHLTAAERVALGKRAAEKFHLERILGSFDLWVTGFSSTTLTISFQGPAGIESWVPEMSETLSGFARVPKTGFSIVEDPAGWYSVILTLAPPASRGFFRISSP